MEKERCRHRENLIVCFLLSSSLSIVSIFGNYLVSYNRSCCLPRQLQYKYLVPTTCTGTTGSLLLPRGVLYSVGASTHFSYSSMRHPIKWHMGPSFRHRDIKYGFRHTHDTGPCRLVWDYYW